MEPNGRQADEEHAILSPENGRQRISGAVSDDERLSLYCEALLADPRITMVQMLDMQRPLEVARVYVPLRLSEEHQQKYATPPGDEASTNTTEDDPNFWIEEERQRRERHVEEIYDPEKALHTFHRCMIIGDPGAGKTTLLRHLAIMAAQHSIAGITLPVYVELQSFVHSGLPDLLDFVSATWEEAYAFPAQQARLLLANYLNEGKALLLLDALDETVVGETLDSAEQSYETVSQAIFNLTADYPKAPMVVTMRKASYRQHKPLVNFIALEVMDFRFEDVKQCVQNWYDAAHDLHAEEKSTDLIKRLGANPRLQTLAANPLMLTLMMLAYKDQFDLPERRADLYYICIEMLLTRWDALYQERRHVGTAPCACPPEQKHQLLKAIAWHFHRKRQRYFTKHDLLQVIAAFLPTIGLPAERNHDILQEIESEQGVLKEQAAGWHGFVHLTLQEYFAAEYINDYQKDAELLRHRADPWWEEVLLLYIGITPDASPFLQELCSENSTLREDIFYTNLLLAGRCLTTRPTVRETALQAQIIDRLFELFMSTQFSLLRQEALKVVCGIGVLETNRRLVTLLSDEQLHMFMRRSITGTLGMLGEPSVAEDLVQLLADERLDVNLKWRITDALGRLGERSIAGELVQLLADDQLDVYLRWSIVTALGRLGERSVAGDLVQLLSDNQLDVDLRLCITDALGRLGERSVAGDLVLLLADDQQDVNVRRNIADSLGRLGDPSVVGDLVQLLSDDQLDANVRRAIADSLGRLGDPSVAAGVMVQLLADDEQDVFVRRRITGALGTLGEPSVAGELVQLMSNEWLNVELRLSIADALGTLGERSVASELVQLLADDQQDVNVRRAIADALGRLGERSVAAKAMMRLLADDRQDAELRWSVADALGRLGEKSVASELVRLLADDQQDADLRWSIAGALGALGERSVVGELVRLLTDDRQDVNVRRAVAIALSMLGERPGAAKAMVQLLAGNQFGVFVQRSIAGALGALGERSVAGDLVQLLTDERLYVFTRVKIAEALGTLGEPSVAADLVRLLADDQLDVDLRRSIADALAVYAHDNSIVEGLVKLLDKKEISDSVYSALWTISRRGGVWILPFQLTTHTNNVTQSQARYEIVPWE